MEGDKSIMIEITIVLISCNESHRHAEIDFRDGYKDRGGSLTYDLVNAEKSFIMSCEGVSKNACQFLADSNETLPRDISGNRIFNILVTCKDVFAVSSVPGFEQ